MKWEVGAWTGAEGRPRGTQGEDAVRTPGWGLRQPPTARPRLLPPRLGGGDFPLFRRPGVGASWGSPLPQGLLCRE